MTVFYPNEAYPSDSDILALDGGVDLPTGLPYVAKGVGPTSTPTYEIQYNRRLARQNAILAAVRQGMVVDEGSLQIGMYPIDYTLGGVRKSFPGAMDQSIPDDTSRVVYLDANNDLQIQSSFPTDLTTFLPLATVVTAAGKLILTDERPVSLFEVSPVGTAAKTIPMAPSVYLAGTLSVKVYEIEWVAPVDFTLVYATGRVATAPVGAALIVDIRDDGTSIFADDSERINMAGGTQQDTSATKNHAVDAGDVLTFEVKQIGSTTPGADLTIVIKGLASVTLS